MTSHDLWWAEDDVGDRYSEAEFGSIRNLPNLSEIRMLCVRGYCLLIPENATPVWLRRVSINMMTGEQTVRIMIGWEFPNGGEKQWHWVAPDSSVEITAGDPDA